MTMSLTNQFVALLDHYKNFTTIIVVLFQVYGSSSGGKIKLVVCIEDHKFNPKNYW